MKSKRVIEIARPSMGEEEWQALREPIINGWLTQGPLVKKFEATFAREHGVEYGVATSSCTTSLHLSLVALGIREGDEVIVPSFTWVSTANVVVYCGATPVFVDVSPSTFNLDPDKLSAALTSRTRAVIAVHLFGLCADIDAIRAQLPEDVAIIEDAACAAGAKYKGNSAGSLGTVGCFSFHPRKSITTGEGGMITTNDSKIAQQVIRLRNHGASIPEEDRHRGPEPFKLPDFDELGYNYRMTDLQAAVGLVQLDKLHVFIKERSERAAWYSDALSELEWLALPSVPVGYVHGWQAFVTRVEHPRMSRNELMVRLFKRGIHTRPGTHAVPQLGYYRKHFGFLPNAYPTASHLEQSTMALPLHNGLTNDDYEFIVESIKELS